jgi:hypothetical protein
MKLMLMNGLCVVDLEFELSKEVDSEIADFDFLFGQHFFIFRIPFR